MSEFRKILPTEITDNMFKTIGDEWMLVTAAKNDGNLICGEGFNTMTASWGGVGILWGKPVVFVFVRPQRHTFGFIEESSRLTLSFFDSEYKKALAYCGKYSGRDVDKIKECALTVKSDEKCSNINNNDSKIERAVWFDEARLVIKAKKLYASFIDPEKMTDPYPMYTYEARDFHKMYICEIEEVLEKIPD